jgi:hypothetical protein
MKENTDAGTNNLRELAVDLNEVYDLINDLCTTLQGGGIVQARDIEPSVAKAVPKLRRAVDTLKAAAAKRDAGGGREHTDDPHRSPLLM